ncbi:hypothetical protein EW146_g352 [Bondarzewia mesenterica]|uniref:NADH:flavin oxidoreductase/NADH oxidase N-terminal domain-containing protein n=1 Tax=Bondarzewia mesenterica TaxID=1095465 RepID=A0A4S4M981_9AGAM|nr:hypothetical protein EW146_g352 [Bondarzewia mesenterica]
MVVPRTLSEEALQPFKQLVDASRDASDTAQSGSSKESLRPLIIMQLSHAGRQSPSVLGGRLPFVPAMAPSPVALGQHVKPSSESQGTSKVEEAGWVSRLVYRFAFQTPREMTAGDIDEVVDQFVRGARVAWESGFDGIELHASHGYSIQSNRRVDEYSARTSPLRLLHRIASSIRAVVPPHFALGVKVNSADYMDANSPLQGAEHGPDVEQRALAHVTEIASWNMFDFIEISGGDYESPDFMATSRQAFFSRFARLARSAIHELSAPVQPPLVLLTGGLRSAEVLNTALIHEHADILGIGRGSVLCHDLPRLLAAGGIDSMASDTRIFPVPPDLTYPDTPFARKLHRLLSLIGFLPLPRLIGAGVRMAWYVVMIGRLARGKSIDMNVGGMRAITGMWARELGVILCVIAIFNCATIWMWVW